MNILVCSLGESWQVIPEIFALTNPQALPLYAASPEVATLDALRERHAIVPVDMIWVASTAGTERAWRSLEQWRDALPAPAAPELRRWYPLGIGEIAGERDDRLFADLAHRLMLHARARATGLYLCLAGGRKTMSAWLQQAAHRFGCDLLLHVVDRFDDVSREAFRRLGPRDLAVALPAELADRVRPLVTAARLPGSAALHRGALRASDFPLPPAERCPPSVALIDAVEQRLAEAGALLANYAVELSGADPAGSFRALYALPPAIVDALHERRIGSDPLAIEADLAWLARLPKAELHCHLGGVLDPAELVEVAAALETEIEDSTHRTPELARWRARLDAALGGGDPEQVRALLPERRAQGLPEAFALPEPLAVAAFLLAFRGREPLLDEIIYGALRDPGSFCGIGIGAYEALGDLQGSGLLQHEETLRAAMRVLERRCRNDAIRYLELRCSPLNYERAGLTRQRVVEILLEEADRFAECQVRIGFIASRHADLALARAHVTLATDLLAASERFRRRFAGFDLAGAEHACRPAELRGVFRPLREQVVRTTIHAGEGEQAENIWEAVYELAADRIGHGLTLGEAPDLLARLRDRRIAIEMCPSSNFQIVGYRDHLLGAGPARRYPLRRYLEHGLRVTVNTDNPGISRTTLSGEYLKAGALSEHGLTRWEVLRLIRNGFRAAFCGHRERRDLLLAAERGVVGVLGEEGPR